MGNQLIRGQACPVFPVTSCALPLQDRIGSAKPNSLRCLQVLRDLCVATVDLEMRRVRLIMDDVEGAIADLASATCRCTGLASLQGRAET